jgi:hypothetical protein
MASYYISRPSSVVGWCLYPRPRLLLLQSLASTTLNPIDHGGRILTVGGTLAADLTLTLPTINVSTNPATIWPRLMTPTLRTTKVCATPFGFPRPSLPAL